MVLHGAGVGSPHALPENERPELLSGGPGGVQASLGHLPGKGSRGGGNALGHVLIVRELGLIRERQAELLQLLFGLVDLLLPLLCGGAAQGHRHLLSASHLFSLPLGGEDQIIGRRDHRLLTHHKAFDGNPIGGCIQHRLGSGNPTGGGSNHVI